MPFTHVVDDQSLSLIKCSICSYHPLMRTLRMNGSRKRFTACDTQSYHFITRFSKTHRPFSHSENSAKTTDIPTSGPQLIKDGRRTQCSTVNYVPIVVPGLSTSSSISATPTSPASLPQEAVIPTLHPESTRSQSTSSRAWGDPSPGPTETENTKNEDNETRCVTCQNGKNLRKILWEKEFQHTGTHQRVFLVNQLQSRGEKWYRITADHKVLCEGCESPNHHRYVVVVQDLATQWIQFYPCKNKTSQETEKELTKVLGADEETKSHLHSQFPRIWQSLCGRILNSLYVNTHRSKTNGTAERAVRKIKEETSAVLLQSGLGEKWSADSMECVTAICETLKTCCLMGTVYEGRFREPFKGPVIPFGSMVEYHSIPAKDLSRLRSWLPVLTGRQYRRPSLAPDEEEWREKKKILNERKVCGLVIHR